jgi:hypothetical protein
VDFDQIQNPMINSDFSIGSSISVLSCDELADRGSIKNIANLLKEKPKFCE